MRSSQYDEPSPAVCRAVSRWSRWARNIRSDLSFWVGANCRVARSCAKLDPSYEAARQLLELMTRELPDMDEALVFPLGEQADPLYEGVLRCLPEDMRTSSLALRTKLARIEMCLRHVYYVDEVVFFQIHGRLPEPSRMIESVIQNLTLQDICLTYAFFDWIRIRGEIIQSGMIELEAGFTFG